MLGSKILIANAHYPESLTKVCLDCMTLGCKRLGNMTQKRFVLISHQVWSCTRVTYVNNIPAPPLCWHCCVKTRIIYLLPQRNYPVVWSLNSQFFVGRGKKGCVCADSENSRSIEHTKNYCGEQLETEYVITIKLLEKISCKRENLRKTY